MSERDLMLQRDDATYAQAILDNPLWKRLFSEIREGYYHKLIACPARDREGRDILLTRMKACEEVIGFIDSKINGGKAAAIDLEQYARTESKATQLARRFT